MRARTSSVCCVGSAAWDITMALPELPRPGDEVFAELLGEGPGGKAANAAASAALAGVPTVLVCRLGDDPAGRAIREAASRLRCLRMADQTGRRTPLADVLLTPGGERTILSVYSPDDEPEPAPTALSLVARADVVWIQMHDPERRARFHAAGADDWIGLPLEDLEAEVGSGRRWTFAVGSADEVDTPDDRLLEEAGTRLCVVTEGEAGGRWWTPRNGWRPYPAAPASAVIDTCGAGDAFVGGLLAELAGRTSDEAAVLAGAHSAARIVARMGAWPGPLPVTNRRTGDHAPLLPRQGPLAPAQRGWH